MGRYKADGFQQAFFKVIPTLPLFSYILELHTPATITHPQHCCPKPICALFMLHKGETNSGNKEFR